MHELSIIRHIIKIAEQTVAREKAKEVTGICLEMGELNGIEMSSFDFLWPAAVSHTVLEGVPKRIEVVKGRARCRVCQHSFPVQHLFDPCPICGSHDIDITHGEELRVKSLEIIN